MKPIISCPNPQAPRQVIPPPANTFLLPSSLSSPPPPLPLNSGRIESCRQQLFRQVRAHQHPAVFFCNNLIMYGPGSSIQPPNGDWEKVLALGCVGCVCYVWWPRDVAVLQVYQSLHECCSYGLVGEAEKLVQEGKFTINSPDKDGNTPLHWASNGDHLHVIKVSASTAPPPPTPLHPCLLLTMMRKILLLFHSFLSLAFYFIPRTHIMQYLTSAGASPNHRGKDGQTPLHWAAIRGFVRSASELLGAGAAIDIRDDFGFSAFLRSVQSGHMGLANFLLASGASIENCDNEGHNAMHWAAYVQPPLPSLKNGNTLCQVLWLHQHVRAAAPQGSPAAPFLGQRWFDALHDRMPFWLHQHRFVTGS
jgi:hypothetical protein